MLAGLSPLIFILAGVPVSVTGPALVMPAQPDPAHMEVAWPTSQMAMYTEVLMDDGTHWQVPRVPKRLSNGSVSFTLKPPTSTAVTTFVVAKADLETPMWWVGEVIETPPGEDPELPGPVTPEVPTDPATILPQPPVEPPAEG